MELVDFLSEPSLNIYHTQFILLLVNAIVIAVVGPSRFLPTFHRRLRPLVWGILAAGAMWTLSSSAFLPENGHPARWMGGTSLLMMGLFFGLTFYAAKVHRPIFYGSLEIAAGACGLALVAYLEPTASVAPLVFGSATSIYIVVRGLTNINDALSKPPHGDGDAKQVQQAGRREGKRRPGIRRPPNSPVVRPRR